MPLSKTEKRVIIGASAAVISVFVIAAVLPSPKGIAATLPPPKGSWASSTPATAPAKPTARPWTIAAYGESSCGHDYLMIGNATDQEISYISGKFVMEVRYSNGWHADSELGGFFADIVPPHGWRQSVSYGPHASCGDDNRIRIVRIDRCMINGVNLGNLCAVNMQPVEIKSWQIPVIGIDPG